MNLDLRLPIGLMFSLFAVMLTLYGFVSDKALTKRRDDRTIVLSFESLEGYLQRSAYCAAG
jgi:hypothetical protein